MSRTQILVVGDSALRDRAAALFERVEARARPGAEFTRLEGAGSAEFFLKGGPVERERGRRLALERLLLRRPPPRLREYECFRRVHAAGFAAPEAVFAAARVASRGVVPTRVLSQLLVTVRVPSAAGYEALLSSRRAHEREAALDALAATLARFHAAGFEHGDLFARNLVHHHRADGTLEPVLLDMWRGGRRHDPLRTKAAKLERTAARDLALLLTDFVQHTDAAEQARFLALYRTEFAAAVHDFDAQRFTRALAGGYARAVARLTQDPARRHGRPLPPGDWRPPALDAT